MATEPLSGTLAPPLGDTRATEADGTRTTAAPPADWWLDLPMPPLDLNGPSSDPHVPFEANWVEHPIFDLFRRTVERAPDDTAVDDGIWQLTYREVWEGACRLAHVVSAAVPADRPVGVLLPNEAYYPVAVLSCLAAARPCVVLDRHYPATRNLAIMRDAGLAAIIVEGRDASNLTLFPDGLAAIPIDPAVRREALPVPPPTTVLPPDDPAVIVYTSGSTGEPKGIVLSQRAILHRAAQLIDSVHLGPDDVSLPLGSPCTIAGIQQVLEALLAGALLVKLDLQRIGFHAVLDAIREKHVTLLFATPALLRSLARLEGVRDSLGNLRCVHPSGEVLLTADLCLLRECLPASCGIIVVYGLTEAPAICQWFVPHEVADQQEARVPVGFRLPGYDCAVLDRDDRPVGPDETGELVIRSRYTAIGEWQGGRAVAGRLTPDPADPSLRILRTGDLVRARRDGVVVVVGRADRQVQIRGMRVEPYEVENVLRRSPAVFDAAVVARDEGESVTLVAFVVLRAPPSEAALAELRVQLRAALPSYMQPARIVPTEAMPLLPGHKVDVEALLALDSTRSGDDHVEPQAGDSASRSRAMVARPWGRILAAESFTADAPFCAAGGDSLGLLLLVFDLEAQCGLRLPLSAFDLCMRPSEMARALDDLLAGGGVEPDGVRTGDRPNTGPSRLVLLAPGDRMPPVFMAHGMGGHVGELMRLAPLLRSGHPIYALQATGIEGEHPIDRIEEIAQYFGDAIEALQPSGPCLLVGYSLGGLIMLEVAQRVLRHGREIALFAMLDTYPHPRFWPLGSWLKSLGRRGGHHISVLAGLPLRQAIPRAARLGADFVEHIGSRLGLRPQPRAAAGSAELPALRRLRESLMTAEAQYQPGFYPGKLTFLSAEIIDGMPDDPVAVWGPLAKEVEVITVPGSHVSMMFTESLAAQLRYCIERGLAGGEASTK